jgi:hypothetical protein
VRGSCPSFSDCASSIFSLPNCADHEKCIGEKVFRGFLEIEK